MARRKAPPGRSERLRNLLGSGLGRLLVRCTLAALVFLLAGIVMRQARAYTYRMPDFRVGTERIELVDLPPWADERVHWALQPRNFRPFSVSLYSPSAESLVRAHVGAHPMIRKVEDLRLVYPNGARLRPVLRVPVARIAVWVDDRRRGQVRRWRLLSDDGCLLPSAPYKGYLDRLPYPLPAVVGITEPTPRCAGEVWEDRLGRVQEAVAAGGLAARLYKDFRGTLYVTKIDVSRFTPTGRWRLGGEVRLTISCPPVRKDGPRVIRTVEWGRTERASDDVEREDSYVKKFERLHHALKHRADERAWDVRMPDPQPLP